MNYGVFEIDDYVPEETYLLKYSKMIENFEKSNQFKGPFSLDSFKGYEKYMVDQNNKVAKSQGREKFKPKPISKTINKTKDLIRFLFGEYFGHEIGFADLLCKKLNFHQLDGYF